jgi:DNA-binding transcriptional MerR regulator
MTQAVAEDVLPGYSSTQVCEIAGVTYRQLDYWTRTGIVAPSVQAARGSGTCRRYSDDDVAKLRSIVETLLAGFELEKAVAYAAEIRDRGFAALGNGLYVVKAPDAS